MHEGTAHARSCLQIHWPVTGNVGPEVVPAIQQTWKALEQLVKDVMPLSCSLVPTSCYTACIPCRVTCQQSAQSTSYVIVKVPADVCSCPCVYTVHLVLVYTGAGVVMLRVCTQSWLGLAPPCPVSTAMLVTMLKS